MKKPMLWGILLFLVVISYPLYTLIEGKGSVDDESSTKNALIVGKERYTLKDLVEISDKTGMEIPSIILTSIANAYLENNKQIIPLDKGFNKFLEEHTGMNYDDYIEFAKNTLKAENSTLSEEEMYTEEDIEGIENDLRVQWLLDYAGYLVVKDIVEERYTKDELSQISKQLGEDNFYNYYVVYETLIEGEDLLDVIEKGKLDEEEKEIKALIDKGRNNAETLKKIVTAEHGGILGPSNLVKFKNKELDSDIEGLEIRGKDLIDDHTTYSYLTRGAQFVGDDQSDLYESYNKYRDNITAYLDNKDEGFAVGYEDIYYAFDDTLKVYSQIIGEGLYSDYMQKVYLNQYAMVTTDEHIIDVISTASKLYDYVKFEGNIKNMLKNEIPKD